MRPRRVGDASDPEVSDLSRVATGGREFRLDAAGAAACRASTDRRMAPPFTNQVRLTICYAARRWSHAENIIVIWCQESSRLATIGSMDHVQQPSGDRDLLYAQVASEFGQPLGRLAAAYELEPSRQQDLVQELHFAIWRSLAGFKGQCSLRTWVYRVAHNAATTYVRQRQRHRRVQYVNIEDLDCLADESDIEHGAHIANVLAKVRFLIERLKPVDRNVLLLHLEGLTAAEIAEVVGISIGYASQKVHRVVKHLRQHFRMGRES